MGCHKLVKTKKEQIPEDRCDSKKWKCVYAYNTQTLNCKLNWKIGVVS